MAKKKMGHSRESIEKASKSMGKGMSGMMNMSGGKGNKAYCPKISKLD